MGYGYRYDRVGQKCSGKAQPGTIALRDETMDTYPVGDLGIYACRPVRVSGSATLSFHAEGRAWDPKIATKHVGDDLARFFVTHADALGIQEVIWWEQRWTSEAKAWRRYTGDDNHHGHAHVTQCWAAAREITRLDVRACFAQFDAPEEEDEMAKWITGAGGKAIDLGAGRVIDNLTDKNPIIVEMKVKVSYLVTALDNVLVKHDASQQQVNDVQTFLRKHGEKSAQGW